MKSDIASRLCTGDTGGQSNPHFREKREIEFLSWFSRAGDESYDLTQWYADG